MLFAAMHESAHDPEQTSRAVAQTSPVAQTLIAPEDKID
jgi:hypothetical protein